MSTLRDELRDRVDDLESRVRAVEELHVPVWVEERCPTPRKGCDRDDCRIARHGEITAWAHYHERGYQACDHCTDLGPQWPYEVPWPCPTTTAINPKETQ